MAIDHERSPLVKPEFTEKTSQKVEPPCPSPVKVVQPEQPEEMEEDELQVESSEIVDESLKITNDDDDDEDSKERSR